MFKPASDFVPSFRYLQNRGIFQNENINITRVIQNQVCSTRVKNKITRRNLVRRANIETTKQPFHKNMKISKLEIKRETIGQNLIDVMNG